MTRAESQARTREHVIAAAAEAFSTKGFHGASLDEIAEAAGYSRGAVYSNFADKADVFLAVVDERMHRRIAQVGAVLTQSSSPADFFASLRELNRRQPREEGRKWYMLNLEVWLYAMRNPDVQPRLAERERTIRAALTRAIEALYAALPGRPPMPTERLAVIVNAIDMGTPYQEFLDPDAVGPDFATEALQFILEAGAALAESTGPARGRG